MNIEVRWRMDGWRWVIAIVAVAVCIMLVMRGGKADWQWNGTRAAGTVTVPTRPAK